MGRLLSEEDVAPAQDEDCQDSIEELFQLQFNP
jgi:hypothetical protein